MAESKANSDPITLTRFILQQQQKHENATGAFTILMTSIQLACKSIQTSVRKAGIAGLYGLEGAVNVQGEDQKKLDIIANDNFINACTFSEETAIMVSEENPDPIFVDGKCAAGKYMVVFDPLDGSSNIDCNVSVGSIFGIYKKEGNGQCTLEDVLQPGHKLIAAGYCMYGSSTQLVLTMGRECGGVNIFTLDPSIGEFILTHEDVHIPETPKTIYSVNEGNAASWHPVTRQFVERVKGLKKPYSLRYVGSMVADVHRTLLYGGIFMYPADKKSPNGKLRLLYESNPMSFIIETAGGRSTTGTQRVLDIQPESIHQRCPIYCGCARDVDEVVRLYAEHATAGQAAE